MSTTCDVVFKLFLCFLVPMYIHESTTLALRFSFMFD